jgi:hypothetical protein
MRKTGLFIIYLMGWLILESFGQADVVFEHKLPPGWKYKSFSISRSGLKALCLLPDLPVLVLLKSEFQKRLQVFDKDGNLINDLMLEKWCWLHGFTRDNNIALTYGDEDGTWSIEVIDLRGKKISSTAVGGRWPTAAHLGKDIAFIPRRGEDGAVSIVDEATGREKARFEQPTHEGKTIEMSCFLPIGEDGMYVVGVGGTLFLRSYLHPGKDIWKIPDIGGDIHIDMFLDDELIGVSYERNDFDAGKLMAGTAIIEWRTGKILFNKQGYQIDHVQDDWYGRLCYLTVLIVDGDLIFRGLNGDVRLPRCADPEKGWDESRLKKCRLLPSQTDITRSDGKHARPEEQRNYIIKDFGDAVRVEKCKYVDDAGPGPSQPDGACRGVCAFTSD